MNYFGPSEDLTWLEEIAEAGDLGGVFGGYFNPRHGGSPPRSTVAGGFQSGPLCSRGHQSGMRGKSVNFRQRRMPPSSHHWLARQLREPAAWGHSSQSSTRMIRVMTETS